MSEVEQLKAKLDRHILLYTEAMIELNKVSTKLDAVLAKNDSLMHAIEGALRIKDLWLPVGCEPEHEGECQALGSMHSSFVLLTESSN